jgi:C1A family cysteine protease
MYYESGIINDENCGTRTNHAIVAVGWGSENGVDYFIVRNSWGAAWGEDGYGKIAAKSSKTTGICALFFRKPSYPEIE